MPEGADYLIGNAIAFHDLILEPGSSDNERRSADVWMDLAPAGTAWEEKHWVNEAIAATARHLVRPEASKDARDALVCRFLDLDLTPLGEERALFVRNTRLLRAENAHLEDASWERQRLDFLTHFHAAPFIFATPEVGSAFEERAKKNLAKELADVDTIAPVSSPRSS